MNNEISQTAVCNQYHSLEQQLCRWLLSTLDRLPSNELTITQELIANMLGVRREGITEAAGHLQQAGFIHCRATSPYLTDRDWNPACVNAMPWSRKNSIACWAMHRTAKHLLSSQKLKLQKIDIHV